MKTSSPITNWRRPLTVSFARNLNCAWRSLSAAALLGAGALTCAQAQIQTAGTLFINVDATGLTGADGTAENDITNSGSLGGFFEGTGIYVTNAGGVYALGFPGGSSGSSGYLQLKNGVGGSLVAPPAGLVGSRATCSIETWVLNPQVTGDESMIAWGARSAGQNAAFEYGTGTSGGFQRNGAGNDIPWETVPSANGAPLNGYWHYLVYTCDGSTQRLYADGVLVNSQSVGAYTTATSSGIAMGAQWTSAGTAISTTPAYATLAIARMRVHDDVLTAGQVLSNYNFEKATFQPPPPTPVYLTAAPVHRYSFSEPATNDATGLTFHDSIGGADGVVQGSYSNNIPQFSGRRLLLPGGVQTQIPGYGSPYGDLPNNLVSTNSVYLGGSGEVSIEIWYKNNGLSESWSRLFDIGSCGSTAAFPTGQQGTEVTETGDYPPGYVASGYSYLDTFAYAAQQGGSANQRQLIWQNRDVYPLDTGGNYTATNNPQVNANVQLLGSVGADRHVVVTWKESTGLITAYENGVLLTTITALTNMTALNDVNVWLGRSLSGGDGGFDGEYDEVRLYTNVLTAAQVYGDYLVGPNTINTNAQAAKILTPPQSQSVNQGWTVTFYVEAAGSPAVSYQWNRNGAPVSGATSDTYTLGAANLSNNNDQYACVVSNYTTAANVVTSSVAMLTVVSNVAPPFVTLHETRDANPAAAVGSQRDNYDGTVGALFETGPAGAVVTHLGMYDVYGAYDGGQVGGPDSGFGLQRDHLVSLYSGDGATLLGSVDVPAGTSAYLYKSYRYVALPAPIYLAPNSNYIIQADVYNGDGDMWADATPTFSWDPYFVGNNGPATRGARYGSHGSAVNGASTGNGLYWAPNLAALPIGAPVIAAQQTGVTQYVNLSATLSVTANGQSPLTIQWYKVGSPDTALPGQNGLSLVLPSVSTSDQGNYYAIVSNAISTAQCANIYLQVFSDTAVSITQQPTNITVLQGYSATFDIVAAGTPPIGYQWYRNSSLIAGATSSAYTLAAAAATNNGDLYSCVVSNYANGSPHTLPSANAMLTVTPNQAPVAQLLFAPVTGTRDTYSGVVGGIFKVGATDALVTHLGYYITNGATSLNFLHHVGIFSADGSTLLASVAVPDVTSFVLDNYLWDPLPVPLVLTNNTSYIIAAEVYSGSGDPWPDIFAANWNPYYVGNNPASTQIALYSAGGATFPTAPNNGNVTGSLYGPGNLAILPAGPPVVLMLQTNETEYATSNATFAAFVDGQPPLSVHWYKVGPPDTAVPGQTNATLMLNNLALSDSGTYYLIATNNVGSMQGSNATLTVLPAGKPNIIQQPVPQTVYVHQSASFSVAASVPPLSYQWWFGNNPISGATDSTYSVLGATLATAGNYMATLSNSFGVSTSEVAVLTVLNPPAGSYADTMLQLDPLVYYRFSDISSDLSAGTNSAFNLGSLGPAATGTYEGNFTAGPGPQPPTWPNFEPTNQALVLDPNTLDVDVKIPALNLDPGIGPNITLTAWVNPNNPQSDYDGIIFYRGSGGASGMGIRYNGDLEYHWDNLYFGFATGLNVPTNGQQWSFVALVVEPTDAVLYLNTGTGFQSVTNVAPHGGVSFSGPMYVGWDDNDAPGITTTRRFVGMIDEPAIFDRSLSANEISALYHAGIGPVKLQAGRSAGNIVLSWSVGKLQQSSQPGTGFVDTPFTSPFTNAPGPGAMFYRVRVP